MVVDVEVGQRSPDTGKGSGLLGDDERLAIVKVGIGEVRLVHEHDLVPRLTFELEQVLDDREQAELVELRSDLLVELSPNGVMAPFPELDPASEGAIEREVARSVARFHHEDLVIAPDDADRDRPDHEGRQPSWTSSTRTPPIDFGCTNAISVLREPASRDLVDQPDLLAPQLIERRRDVGHAIRDVMDAGPVRREEPADRRVGRRARRATG